MGSCPCPHLIQLLPQGLLLKRKGELPLPPSDLPCSSPGGQMGMHQQPCWEGAGLSCCKLVFESVPLVSNRCGAALVGVGGTLPGLSAA